MKTISHHYYVIRHIPTGKFLPEPTGRAGRGGSHTEPVDGYVERPRLFLSELSAKRALASWLMGKHRAVMATDSDEYGGNSFTYQAEVEIVPVSTRKREEMEIIQAHLMVY